ncbi:MAG: hypothetical protein EOP52_13980 [Sphingobacteriales bacterium]|nr:MAG: hypothetical protein EOP52_13980 [Sphingobacteriales bacterium]
MIVEPWQVDKKYPKGYLQFSLEITPISARSARYGIQYKDISTREEREHWIAGSSLQVIDLELKTLVAERIGYMIDPTQGDRTGGRSPWLYAAAYACPEFARDLPEAARRQSPKSLYQLRQTQRFVEKVIAPAQ